MNRKTWVTFVRRAMIASTTVWLVAGCTAQPDGEMERTVSATILKCDGTTNDQDIVGAVVKVWPAKAEQRSFRVRHSAKEIDIWERGKFERLCDAPACLKAEPEHFFLSHHRKGKLEDDVQDSIRTVDIDRVTGAITYTYADKFETHLNKGEFKGVCSRSSISEISATKF